MDMHLERGTDGSELAEEILQRRELPILFLSGYSDKETVERARRVANYGYVLKDSGEFVIIESIRAALKLFESRREQRRRNSFFTRNPIPMFLVDAHMELRTCNEAARQYLDETVETAEGRRIGEALSCLNHLNDPRGCGYSPACSGCELRSLVTSVFADGQMRVQQEATLPIRHEREQPPTTFLVSITLFEEDGTRQALVALEDISERKRSEELLRKNQILMDQAEKLTGVGAWEKDLQRGVFILSRGCQEVHGMYRREVPIEELDRTIHPDDVATVKEAAERAVHGNGYYHVEHRVIRADDGEVRSIQAQGKTIYDEAGTPVKMYGAIQDITEQKMIERKNQQLVREKENLLKEVHHRIKNHMNTIFSILSLQASKFDDEEVSSVFEETKARIRLMQSIYQKLYTGTEVDSISIKHYLEELIREIKLTYRSSKNIRVESEIEDIRVSARQSLPIGIIVNELVTNSFKYAFYGTDEGSIEIKANRIPPNHLEIRVADDGAGLPEEITEERRLGFGLTIVEGYARQFEGSLEFAVEGDRTVVKAVLELED
jgi:PAS domain S-box-containing protein